MPAIRQLWTPAGPTTLETTVDWRQDAACAQTDPEAMYPKATDQDGIAKAKAICADCPVRVQCLQLAFKNNEEHGVWGGLSEQERRRLRRNKARATATAPCGTEAGARRHRRYGEPVDAACLSAVRAAERRRRANHRAATKTAQAA